MLMKISNQLRNKIRRDLIILNQYGIYSSDEYYRADLYFSQDEDDLLMECIKWWKDIDTYFKTSYNTYKINCGRFKGVFPRKVYRYAKMASFYVDSFGKESWEDWFIMEGEINASKQSIKLLPNVCNS